MTTARWWCPETYGHDYTGWTTIERATLRSDNTVYAQLTLDVTPEAVAKMAQKLGVRSRLDVDGAYVPSIGLGAMDVSPLDMASAYATLAAGGVYSEPMAIRKVVLPDGEDTNAGWGKPKRKRVISDGVAATVTRILEENIRYGTGRGGVLRAAGGREDGHDRGMVGRLVLRLHPSTRHDGLGRISEGQDLDDQRARDPRHRRQLPRADLAPLHELRNRTARAGGVPRAEARAGVEGLRARPVRALVRLLPRSELRRARDDDRGDDDWRRSTPPAAPPAQPPAKKKKDATPLAPPASHPPVTPPPPPSTTVPPEAE